MYLLIIFHFVLAIWMGFHPFLIKNKRFDSVYILYVFLVILGWTLFKGECFITYFAKKRKDPSYEMGDTLINEYYDEFPEYAQAIWWGGALIQTFVLISVYITLERNHIPKPYTLSFILIYAVYYIYTNFCNFTNEQSWSWLVHEATKWIILMWAVSILMYLQKRIK